jgi:hypothetical protein
MSITSSAQTWTRFVRSACAQGVARRYPAYARFSPSMSIFFIWSIAVMALWDFSESGPLTISGKQGVIF